MKLKAVLFDLDGTLLPMDQNAFTKQSDRNVCGRFIICRKSRVQSSRRQFSEWPDKSELVGI